ncbi:MAG: tetratricopeptide repeat protein, partial [Bacteriovoracaceae bacterium]
NILQNVVDRTENYELKKACMRYLLESNLKDADYIRSLQMAKQLYVAATGQFDDEMIVRSSRVILYSLAKLKQLKKMEEFLNNKAVIRVLPAQEGDAYVAFTNLSKGEKDQVLAAYRANEKSYAKPVHPAILFNAAEAHFQSAEYEQAIGLFDEFLANYSFYDVAAFANLRMALSYDLLGRDESKTLKLYENAINKSSLPEAGYEAKIRYVGLRVARKRDLGREDLETISFLEASPVEKKSLHGDLRKLLWLTRLRTLISQQDYEAALAYLSSVPLDTLRQVERRTFNGDGAEIVLGIIKEAYLKEDYARAVKVWEVFKNKYEDKVAANPYMNFIVSDSFLKLGLTKSFERSFKELEKMKSSSPRVFPRWVRAHKEIDVGDYLNELRLAKIIQNGDWEAAERHLKSLKNAKNINYNYYKGLVSYHLKKYNESTKFFEKLLVKPNAKNILSPRQSLTMLTSYSEALYQGNDQERFRTNTAALLNDLRRGSGANRSKAIERLE